jgi:hypothetical protein
MRAFQDFTMNNEPSFLKLKTAAIQAAAALYPGTNANTATRNAFEAVGICGVSASPPAKVTLTSMGDLLCAGRFNPTWPLMPGVTQYYAEVSPAQLGLSFPFASPVTDVDGETNHCFFRTTGPMFYRIQACNDCGCGPWSDIEYLEYWSPCL